MKLNPKRFASRLAVYVAVYNEKGELLLHKRGKKSGYMVGCWDFPSGHVEDGEAINAAAVRELKEETGLMANVVDLQLIFIAQRQGDIPYTDFLFAAREWGGVPHIMEPDKCDDMRWFAMDDLPEELTPIAQLYKEKSSADEMAFYYIDKDKRA